MAIDATHVTRQQRATRSARAAFRAADQHAKKTGKPRDKAARAAAYKKLCDARDKLKRENFKRLAPGRVQAVLDAIDRLTQLANPARYTWGVDESTRIACAITDRFDVCKDELFRVPGVRAESRAAFSLGGDAHAQ